MLQLSVCAFLIILLDRMTATISDPVFDTGFTVVYNPTLRDAYTIEGAKALISQDLDILLPKFNKLCVFFNSNDKLTMKYIYLIPPLIAKRNLKANETYATSSKVPQYKVCVALDLKIPGDYYETAKTLLAASDEANQICNSTIEVILIGCYFKKFVSQSETLLNQKLANVTDLIQKARYTYKTVGMFSYDECLSQVSLSVIKFVAPYFHAVYFESVYKIGVFSQKTGLDMANIAVKDFEACNSYFRAENLLIPLGYVTEFQVSYGNALFSDCNIVSFWNRLNIWGATSNTSLIIHKTFDGIYRSPDFVSGWWSVSQYGSQILYRERASSDNCTAETSETPSTPTTAITQTAEISSTATIITPETSTLAPKRKDDSRVFEIAAAIFGVIVVLLAAICLYLYTTKRLNSSALSETEIRHFEDGNKDRLENECMDNFVSLPYDKMTYELQPGTFILHKHKILGQGVHGTVYTAIIYKDDVEVLAAAKTVRDSGSVKAQRILLSEIKVLSYVGRHENILELLGAHTGSLRKGKIIVFTELCELGSLEKLLRAYRQQPSERMQSQHGYIQASIVPSSDLNLDENITNDMKRWSCEIANGMEYLAHKNVVHADLATRNVLITNSKKAKIADFGLSKRLYNFQNCVKEEDDYLPWQWLAPEALSTLVFNEKTDVWAFGITLWEIFTLGEIPYCGKRCDQQFVSDLILGQRPASPPYNLNNVYEIMLKCWEVNPDARPNFERIKLLLVEKFGNVG